MNPTRPPPSSLSTPRQSRAANPRGSHGREIVLSFVRKDSKVPKCLHDPVLPFQWEGAEPGLLVCPKVLNRKSAQPLAVSDPSPCRNETMPILDPILDLSVGGRLTPHDSLHVADSCPRYLFQGFTVCQRCQPFCLYTRTRLRVTTGSFSSTPSTVNGFSSAFSGESYLFGTHLVIVNESRKGAITD